MKKILFIAAIAVASIALLQNNFAGPVSKIATVSSYNFLNDTTPKKQKHKKDTTKMPDTTNFTFAKRISPLTGK